MSKYQPGDIVMGTVRNRIGGESELRLIWSVSPMGGRWVDPYDDVWYDHEVSDIRPLVVLDPEEYNEVSRLALLCNRHRLDPSTTSLASALQQGLRSMVKLPKPEEPTGLGAVVEDAEGNRWVRVDLFFPVPWHLNTEGEHGESLTYDEIDVVRVLSEGVAP